ncbi:hypothetical protein LZ30DRAFT_446811 [Colletotrichum cereale]|nr:hypothetical protein LZ30DRAFT_446811 [Colletotrichum cereale]
MWFLLILIRRNQPVSNSLCTRTTQRAHKHINTHIHTYTHIRAPIHPYTHTTKLSIPFSPSPFHFNPCSSPPSSHHRHFRLFSDFLLASAHLCSALLCLPPDFEQIYSLLLDPLRSLPHPLPSFGRIYPAAQSFTLNSRNPGASTFPIPGARAHHPLTRTWSSQPSTPPTATNPRCRCCPSAPTLLLRAQCTTTASNPSAQTRQPALATSFPLPDDTTSRTTHKQLSE